MKRKFLSVLLIVAIAVGFCMPVSAATSLKLTDATYPTTLKQGDPFIARGIITSDYYIRKVVIGVYNSNGTAEFDYTGLPGEKSYDINDVDYLLSFSKLKNGSYTYKIVASDDNSSDVVLLNKSFTVTSTGQAASTLKITNAKYPDTLDVGEGFSVTGIISSNYNITRIVIGAYKADGTKGFEYIAAPNAKSFDVNSVDYSLPFSRLAAGSYTYKITASDTESSNVVLLNKSFTVGSSSVPTGNLTKVNWDVIDISYWNRDSISSWSKIASDIDAIILRLGFAYTASKKMEEDDSFADYYAAAKNITFLSEFIILEQQRPPGKQAGKRISL